LFKKVIENSVLKKNWNLNLWLLTAIFHVFDAIFVQVTQALWWVMAHKLFLTAEVKMQCEISFSESTYVLIPIFSVLFCARDQNWEDRSSSSAEDASLPLHLKCQHTLAGSFPADHQLCQILKRRVSLSRKSEGDIDWEKVATAAASKK